ncbi:MAG: MBL fold metallo-hydrolase [Candidatus Woesearchaeota archaeon]
MDINLKWLGHDAFLLKTIVGKNIYFDPYKIMNATDKADYIFITHSHYDHCSIDDIKKIIQESTVIISTPDCLSKFTSLKIKNVTLVKPGDIIFINDMKLEVVPAYNTNKNFHPKDQDWVGYVLEFDGKRIYHAGDTDLIHEMKNLKNIDYALLPVSGTYVMSADEAVIACDYIKPMYAIPMHYGEIVGSISDAEKFKKNARCNVIILNKAY